MAIDHNAQYIPLVYSVNLLCYFSVMTIDEYQEVYWKNLRKVHIITVSMHNIYPWSHLIIWPVVYLR